MEVKFYASSDTIRRCDTSHYGISQTFTLEQLPLTEEVLNETI